MKLPVVSGKDLVKIAIKLEFVEVRQKGAHKTFKHKDGRVLTIAVHSTPIPPGLLNKIIKQDFGLSRIEFIKLL
ncbi:MAG: type II toxin-antitoxin system HicA family toxin [archaeon]|nr:type II toxin-antitoxin system HicA family toxin [archaeon]